MRCRVPCHSDAKAVFEFLPNVLDEVVCVLEEIRLRLGLKAIFLSPGRISSKRKDIADAQFLAFLNNIMSD